MDFKDLEYFAAIARCGNITRAAQQLYISQPTLSKFLQKLEGDTGLVLFQRAGRRLELTYAGQRYLAHAERLLSQKREMDAELTDLLRCAACGHAAVPVQFFAAGGASGVPRAVPAGAVPH